jgi:hypothetical protein
MDGSPCQCRHTAEVKLLSRREPYTPPSTLKQWSLPGVNITHLFGNRDPLHSLAWLGWWGVFDIVLRQREHIRCEQLQQASKIRAGYTIK